MKHGLGDEGLEVGPGPGLTTDVLCRQVPRLTAVEIDRRLARSLAGRLAAAGFVHVTVEVGQDRFRFAAAAPVASG